MRDFILNKLLVETRPSLSCQPCDRRPIRRRISARAVPQAWHRVWLGQADQEWVVPRSAAAFEQWPHRPAAQWSAFALGRRTSAVGRDTISHPDRGHDDVANAVAGAAALSKFGGYDTSMRWVCRATTTAATPGSA